MTTEMYPEDIDWIRRKPVFFWSFAMAIISSAFIVCFLTLSQLFMHEFPRWFDYGSTVSTLAFIYITVKQGVNLYRVRKRAIYYFLVVHFITAIMLIGLMVRDREPLYFFLSIVIFGVIAMQQKLIRIVKGISN